MEGPYLHGLGLVHGFDCILCHSSGGKGDKRTSCREGRGGGEGGRDEEGRQERTKTGQKVWTRRCYKKPTVIDTENSSQQTTVSAVAVETTAPKQAQCHDKQTPPTPPRPAVSRLNTLLLLSSCQSLLFSLLPPSAQSELVIPEFSRFQQANNVNQLKFA